MSHMERIVTSLLTLTVGLAMWVASTAVAAAEPAHWIVKDPLATVYLFGKTVHGLETIGQPLHFFADLPQKTELDYRDSTLPEFDGGLERFQTNGDAWQAGNVEGTNGIDGLLDADLRVRFPEPYKSLIVDRNKARVGPLSEPPSAESA